MADWVTVCATVSTGLESIAVKECKEKLACKSIREGRGRVYFEISVDSFSEVKILRSVENLFVVLKEFEEGSEEIDCFSSDILEKFYKLPQHLEWSLALSLWKQFTGYKGILFKNETIEGKKLEDGTVAPVDCADNQSKGEDHVGEDQTESDSKENPAKRIKRSNEDPHDELKDNKARPTDKYNHYFQ